MLIILEAVRKSNTGILRVCSYTILTTEIDTREVLIPSNLKLGNRKRIKKYGNDIKE